MSFYSLVGPCLMMGIGILLNEKATLARGAYAEITDTHSTLPASFDPHQAAHMIHLVSSGLL